MNPTITQYIEECQLWTESPTGVCDPVGTCDRLDMTRKALKIAVEALEASCDPATHGWTAGKTECVQHKALSRIQAVIEGKA